MLKNQRYLFILLGCLLAVTSCGSGHQSKLIFKDSVQDQNTLIADNENLERRRLEFAAEKIRVWKEINEEAKSSFKDVKEIFKNKCMNCHDSSYKLPLYGRIFDSINPVHKHQVEGLKAFNFVNGYPFQVPGNPPQISILKAIRSSITERTMPIKSFTIVYPKKKINKEDEKIILAWIDPVIANLQDYEIRYNSIDLNLDAKAKNIFEMKCFRCHANGNNRGGFGGMENTEKLLKSKYVSKEAPEQSMIFTEVRDGKMPPNKIDKLSAEEQYVIRDWLESLNKIKPIK